MLSLFNYDANSIKELSITEKVKGKFIGSPKARKISSFAHPIIQTVGLLALVGTVVIVTCPLALSQKLLEDLIRLLCLCVFALFLEESIGHKVNLQAAGYGFSLI